MLTPTLLNNLCIELETKIEIVNSRVRKETPAKPNWQDPTKSVRKDEKYKNSVFIFKN